jgi:hypothetical protein
VFDWPLAGEQWRDTLLKAEGERREARMHKPIGFGALVLIVGSAVLINSSTAHAQVGGALQYPPPSVGEDAQPPPPARMAPQSVSPRRIELGVSGSSQPPMHHPYRVHPLADIDRLAIQPAPLLGASPVPPPTAAGN